MATSFNAVFGGGTGVPLGAIVAGQFANNASYLPCDGNDYVSATYPLLDKTNLVTTGTNAWVARTLPTNQVWSSMTSNSAGTLTVAVSSTTSGTSSASSSDGGITWTARSIPAGSYAFVVWANNLFVAVGSSVCATSVDGITWIARTVPAGSWSGVAYTSQSGLFVTVSNGQTADYLTSPDGITWTTRTSGFRYASQWGNVFNVNGQFWVLPNYGTGGNSAPYFAVSDDGLLWSYKIIPGGATIGCFNAWYFGSKYYFANSNGSVFYVSADGSNWTVFTPNVNSALAVRGLWVASGYLWTTENSPSTAVWSSSDGTFWKLRTLPTSQAWGAFVPTSVGVVCLPLSASIGAASIAIDSAKFRTPRTVAQTDTDRLYIKVA